MKKSGSSKKKAVKRNKDEKKQALDEKAEQVGVLEHAAYLQRLIWEQTASTSVRRSIRREDNDSDTDRPECMQSRRAPRDEPNRRASGRREDPQQQPQDFVSTRPTISSPPEDEGDSYFARPGAFAVSGELRGSDSNDQGSGADSSPDADANNDLEVEEQEEDDFEALLLATFKEGENEDAEDGQVASDRARLLQRLREQQGRIRELETEAQRIPELESRVQQQREMQENSGEGGPGAIVRASLVEEPVTVQAILVETESESRARQRHFADATHVEVDRQNVLVTDDGSDSEDTKSFLVSLCCQNRRRVILSLVILLVALVLLGAVGALLSKSGGNVGNTMVPSVAPSPQPIETTPTVPTVQPIWPPTVARTTSPTSEPTTHRASPIPTLRTTNAPNQRPATGQPIKASPAPSPAPTAFSVPAKTQPPVFMPDNEPTVPPFSQTTHSPSETLTHSPSSFPTRAPTQNPTKHLSPAPTNRPTLSPSRSPTSSPTRAPTDLPSPFPTLPPVLPPSRSPTRSPTQSPTKSATRLPTRLPTRSPTRSPISPTRSPLPPPTRSPTDAPTRNDSDTPFPTVIGGDIPQGNPPVPFPSPVVRPPTIGTDEWQKVGQDLVGEAAGDSFGRSVALSADGTILAAGGEENDANGLSSGHVRVFLYHKFSRRWEQLGQDINGEAAGDEFGRTVALSADGTTVAAGARYNEGKGVAAGHVRVFRYHSASKQWKRLGQVLEAIHRNDRFGDAVSLSGDGRILAASATWHSFMRNGDQSGQVRMYRFNSAANRWEPFGNFVNGQSRFDKFGDSVAINAQGTIFAAGANNCDTDKGKDAGHIRVFGYHRATNVWRQLGQDIGGENSHDRFGLAVALSADGNMVAGGAFANDGISPQFKDAGHCRVFRYDSTAEWWNKMGQDLDGEAHNDQMGRSVALSADGMTVACGATWNDATGFSSGHVRVFDYDLAQQRWTQRNRDLDGIRGGDTFGTSVALSADGKIVAAGAVGNDGNGSGSGHVRVFES